MTRSKARSLEINVNKLEQKVPEKKKIVVDERKGAAKKAKLDKNPSSVSSSSGEAEKKRKLYKNLLGSNSASSSCELKQLDCTPQSNLQPNFLLPSDMPPSTKTDIAKIDFQVGEIVWAKIKGSPEWPAEIISFSSSKMVVVRWYNDYRVTKMYRGQLFKFLINFDMFAKNFDVNIGLKTAAQEALIDFGNKFYPKMKY